MILSGNERTYKMTGFKHHKIWKRWNKFLKAIFILLWFFWLLMLISGQSDIYAATNWTSTNGKFLTGWFWSSDPTDEEIKDALYGTNSAYTKWWLSNPCNTGNMTVVKQPATATQLPTLSQNTIYVLQTWAITISDTKAIPSCTAIVSSVDGSTTIYSNSQLLNQGMFYTNRWTNWVIIDNISFEWSKTSANGNHARNAYCIRLYWDDADNGITHSISVNNSKVARCDRWIYVWNASKIENVNLTNITLVNNWTYWIVVDYGVNVNINNVVWQSDTEIYFNGGSNSTINNVAFYNLYHNNIYFNWWTWFVVNNAIARIYTTTNGCITNNIIWFISSSNSTSIKCKVYGNYHIPQIGSCPSSAVQLQWANTSLQWLAGSQSNIWCYNWNYVVNPIWYYNNNQYPLLSWITDLTYLTQWCSWESLNCYAITNIWWTYDSVASNYKYSYGESVPTQKQPVRWNGTTLSNWNTDWSSTNFIWSNIPKVTATSTLPTTVGATTSLTVNSTSSLISKYNVLGPHITTQIYNINKWTNTTVTWSNWDGPKAVIFQVTWANYYAMHFMGETEKSTSGPSFTLNGTTMYECTTTTWTAFSNYNANPVSSSPYRYMLPWSSNYSNWTDNANISYTAWNVAGNYTFTGQAIDGNELTTTHTGTIVVNNVAPSANNFTWSSSVWSTAKTGNRKNLSNATEWNCGSGSLTATVYSQWSQWVCSISSNNITYTPNSSRPGWTDQCIIRIVDNEGSTTNVEVYRWGIDPAGNNWPNGSVSINNWAAATNSTSLTLYLTWNSLATQVRFSCNQSNWTSWSSVSSTKSFTLSSTYGCNTTTQWTKTVYAQFKSSTVTWSTASDTIIYDIGKPQVAISFNSNAGVVNITDPISWLSWNQLLYYLWTGLNNCPTSISNYYSHTIVNAAWDTGVTVSISANGLSWTYYLCIYSWIYDRAWNASDATVSSYTFSSSQVECTWTTQPTLTPIGPNNQNQVWTWVLVCNMPIKSDKVTFWSMMPYVIDGKLTVFDYVTASTNLFPTYTFTIWYNLTQDALNWWNVLENNNSNQYPLVMTWGTVSNLLPPSDPIQFDYSVPTSTITSPANGATVAWDFSVTVTDTDAGVAWLWTCYYKTGASATVHERDCNSQFEINYLTDCTASQCEVYVMAVDSVWNTWGWVSMTYNLNIEAPTVWEAEIYDWNYYFDGTQYWFKGSVSLRAPYDGDAVSLCQYKVGNWSWTTGTKDDYYCYANNQTWTANKTITFRAYNGKYGTWIETMIYYDATAPYLDSQTDFGTGCYNTGQTSYFTFVDTGVGINWSVSTPNPPTCDITTQWTWKTCYIKPKIADYLSNVYNPWTIYSNSVNLDWTAPTVSATRNTFSCTNQDVIINIVANDSICGLADRPYTYTFGWVTGNPVSQAYYSASENGTLSVVVADIAWNTATYSTWISNIDKIPPTLLITDASWNECTTITWSVSATDVWCGNTSIQYSWDGETYWTTTNNGVYWWSAGTQNMPVYARDAVWNVVDSTITYTWNNSTPTITTNNYNVWTLTWYHVSNDFVTTNLVTAMNVKDGACGTATVTLSSINSCSGSIYSYIIWENNTVKLTAKTGQNNVAGSCSVTFADDEWSTINGTISFTVNTPLPVITINWATTTCATSKSISATATNSPTTFKYVKISNSTCNASTNFSSATNYVSWTDISMSESDNGKYICFMAANSAWTGYASALITGIDVSGPNGTITANGWVTVNSKQAYSGLTVWLTLSATDPGCSSVSQMQFSCNGSSWSTAETYSTSKSWTFGTSYGCSTTDWDKTIYVRYKDALWNWWSGVSEPVTIDRTAPVCGTVTYKPNSCTSGSVSASIIASDAWVWLQTSSPQTKSFTSNTTQSVTFLDKVWNSKSCIATVNWIDKSGPNAPTSLTVQENNNQKPTLKWTAPSDNGCSSVAWYQVQICSNSSCSSVSQSWTSTTISWTVTTNLSAWTTYTWRVRAKDALWNWWSWATWTVAINSLTFNATQNGWTTSITSPIYRLSGTSVSLSASTYPATKSTWTHVWWNESSTADSNQSSVTLAGNKTVYAIYKKVLTLTYVKSTWVSSIWATSGTITIWNTATSGSTILTTITCNTNSWYSTPKWNGSLNPGTSVTISANTTYTGTCSDTTAPVCSWWAPSTNACISWWVVWTITLTCTDGVGINTTALTSGNITYSWTLFTLSNATVGWSATNKTFQFTYTSKAWVNWTWSFVLPANTVKDAAWNAAASTWSSKVTVDTTAPTTTASGVPSSWTWWNVTVTLSTSTSNMWCNSTHTTYYCVDTANTCTPNTTWTSVSVTCDAWSKCTKYVRYYSKDGLGNAESAQNKTVKIDKEWPTFTFSNASGNECVAWSLSITSASDNNGVWLASSAYKFGGWSWWTATSTWIAARQPWSVIVTWYVRDSLGNQTSKTATYTIKDVAPTANNFSTWNIGKTARSITWAQFVASSSAAEWSCGTGALSYSGVKTNGTLWTCAISNGTLTYTPSANKTGSDSCVITIKDNENSTKDVTVTFSGIDTVAPTCSITEAACTSGNLLLTLTASEAISMPSWWTKSSNTVYTKNVTSNSAVSVSISDTAWNAWSCSITPTHYDKTWPTFTFSNKTVDECTAWSLSITSANDGWCAWLHGTPYSFDNSTWNTTTSKSFSTSTTQPWSGTYTAYVRDALGNVTSKSATWTVSNVAPTASDFTVSNVWTWKTVNWKTLSRATEWDCWTWTLSASLKTDASSSMWSCTVNWDDITFVATWWANWIATCVITIKDNENSTKDITVTWNGVSRPIPQISFADPTPAHNAAITQNRFSTKMNITNIDSIKNFEYKYDNTPYDLMSGLILMYNFDNVAALGESSTLVKDLSNHWYDWTVNWATWTSNGKYGWAYSFDGNDYITINSQEVLNLFGTSNNFTVSARAKPSENTSSHIIWESNWWYWSNASFWIWWYWGAYHCVLGTNVGWNWSNTYVKVAYTPTSLNVWQNISCVISGTTMKMYVDGVDRWSVRISSLNTRTVWSGPIYIWKRSSAYYKWWIDEVRVYDRALSQDEVQFLYKSNLKKTSENTWEFETVNTCLDATWTYNYTWSVVSYVDTQAATGRSLTTNIPLVSVSWTWYDFWSHTASWSIQTLNGTMWTLTVTDKLWNSWWLVYLATSDTLVWKNTNQSISTQNLKFKANSLIYSWLYEWYTNTHVAFGNWVSTTVFNSAHSTCAASDQHCSSDYAIMEYMRRSTEPYDFMCGDVWAYSDNTEIQLEVPAWQIQDTYEWTLWITLQDDYWVRQRWTWATIN